MVKSKPYEGFLKALLVIIYNCVLMKTCSFKNCPNRLELLVNLCYLDLGSFVKELLSVGCTARFNNFKTKHANGFVASMGIIEYTVVLAIKIIIEL